jgi:hypothetical protein
MNSNTATEGIADAQWQSSAGVSNDLAASSAVEVRVARTVAEVEAIREIWSAWSTDRDSDIDFCLKFVWSGPDFVRPHVIVVYRGGRADAMLVGRLERTKMVSRIGYLPLPEMRIRALTFASTGFFGNGSPENCEALVRSILEALQQKEADAALLQQVNTESPLFHSAVKLPGTASRDHVLQLTPHSLLNLSANPEEVWQGLSSGVRSDIKRKKKKVLRQFEAGAKVHCFREPAELEHAIPQVESIAKKTYQRAIGVGFQDTEHIRRCLRFFAERGWLRMYLLTLNEEPAAFWVGTVYQGSFTSDYLSFDPKFSDYSPGTFLLGEVIEDLCRGGVAKLNFGAGEGRYKERFSNCHSTNASVYIFAPGLKGIALNSIRTAVGSIERLAKKALESSRLLPTVKRLWRSRLASKTTE